MIFLDFCALICGFITFHVGLMMYKQSASKWPSIIILTIALVGLMASTAHLMVPR